MAAKKALTLRSDDLPDKLMFMGMKAFFTLKFMTCHTYPPKGALKNRNPGRTKLVVI
jgi:hypothetical protein